MYLSLGSGVRVRGLDLMWDGGKLLPEMKNLAHLGDPMLLQAIFQDIKI